MAGSIDTEDMVTFPVPRRYFSVVIQALARAIEEEGAEAARAPSVSGATLEGAQSERAPIDWTDVESCRRLRRELRAPGARAMLDLAAERPDQLVSFRDVVQESGRGDKQARADLGTLTKAIKRGFGVSRGEAVWPVEARWAAGGESQAYYVMSDEVARAWKGSAEA